METNDLIATNIAVICATIAIIVALIVLDASDTRNTKFNSELAEKCSAANSVYLQSDPQGNGRPSCRPAR